MLTTARSRLLLTALAIGIVVAALTVLLLPPPTFVLVAGGDVNLAENVSRRLKKHGGDYQFEYLRPLLVGDALMANLETVVTENDDLDPFDGQKPSMHEMDPRYLQTLVDEGFDLLTIANNHTLDRGPGGLSDMLGHLDAAGLGHTGAGENLAEAREPWILDTPGVRIGVVALCWSTPALEGWSWFALADRPGVYGWDPEALAEDVRLLRERVDFVIVSVHWSNVYSPEGRRTRKYVRKIIGAGPDLVIGHGGHLAGGVDVVRGVPVVYDLGNLAFGSNGNYDRRSPDDRVSAIARFVFEGPELSRIELMPILTDNRMQDFKPRPAAPERSAAEFEPDLDRYGLEWSRREDGWYVIELLEGNRPAGE